MVEELKSYPSQDMTDPYPQMYQLTPTSYSANEVLD